MDICNSRFIITLLGCIPFCTSARLAQCQELEPRTYSNTPTGVNLLSVGYAYSSGNVLLDPTLPIEDLDGKLNIALIAYVRTFALLGRNAKFKTFIPYAFGDWEGDIEGVPDNRDAQGFGDIRVKLEWNFYGAPALDSAAFPAWQQKTIVGGSILLLTPSSDYDSDKLLNLGSNRWAIRPELGVSRRLGQWALELIGSVWLFGDNDDFFGGNKLEQDPIYIAKGHIIYSLRPGFWVGLGLGYGSGGQTRVNGQPRATKQENFRYGIHMAYPINKHHGIGAGFATAKNNGAGAEFDTFSVRYQYAWGEL